MKITYDSKSKAVYIYLADDKPIFGIIDRTQELTEDVLIDWKKDGTLYGIDILSVETIPVIEVKDD